MPWTEPADVTARWVGPNPPDDDALLLQLIEDAERSLRREFDDVQERIDDNDDTLEVGDVKLVVARMVIRHLRNPDATRQVTETEGPFSRNRTFAGDMPGALMVSDDDRSLLGYLPSGAQRAFTVTPGVQETSYLGGGVPDVW